MNTTSDSAREPFLITIERAQSAKDRNEAMLVFADWLEENADQEHLGWRWMGTEKWEPHGKEWSFTVWRDTSPIKPNSRQNGNIPNIVYSNLFGGTSGSDSIDGWRQYDSKMAAYKAVAEAVTKMILGRLVFPRGPINAGS